jgi:hypothetical protein
MQIRERAMDTVECEILAYFRRYRIQPVEMLFFNSHDCKLPEMPFHAAMELLIRRGMVVKERPAAAYSLTQAGYHLSCAADPRKPAAARSA